MSGELDDEQVAQLHEEIARVLQSVDLLPLTEEVLVRATGPMPTVLRSIDAIHLATALELAPRLKERLVLATHDLQLARAARASGLQVVGVSRP